MKFLKLKSGVQQTTKLVLIGTEEPGISCPVSAGMSNSYNLLP